MDKVSGITAKTYHDKAKSFMEARQQESGEFGVLIDPQNEPQQWGAWFMYFGSIKRGLAQARMKRIHDEFLRFGIQQKRKDERRAGLSYQVPAKFPSDFDESRDWAVDKVAGDDFMIWFQGELDKRASIAAIPPEDRARVVERATKGMNLKRNLDWRPGQ